LLLSGLYSPPVRHPVKFNGLYVEEESVVPIKLANQPVFINVKMALSPAYGRIRTVGYSDLKKRSRL
jgi:hypothetical protein